MSDIHNQTSAEHESSKLEALKLEKLLATEFNPSQLQPQFYMTAELKPGAELTMVLEELSTPEGASQFLRAFADVLQAPDLQAAVTYFCSWYSGVAVASLYFLGGEQLRPDFSAANIKVQLFRLENGHSLNFVIGSRIVSRAPLDVKEQEEWVREGLTAFYGETCRKIFENFAELSGLPIGMIWAQLPGRLDYFVGTWKNSMENVSTTEKERGFEERRERLEQAYHILKNLDSDIFGRKKNPFDIRFRYVEHPTDPSQQMQMRPSCCLYHMLPRAEYCYNCPKLNEKDRAERRARVQAQ
ncbi:(2Fe-2S)-binding protein [Saccharibacillus kuerlensis]|uniref:Ferric siderophore reductase C-terminal domain-containing protein n=1 Tax=Saccharibacillus kuerlensis TaxID=459527 RepID=A0ABQ2L3S9_9BACL|nr:(2Fe-2S)-binding protein [Saccharibacillus kuerlensis]GGO01417.1 hypothetical protein GCM10010969_23760 [Saccharibacillus kuerlensis]